MKMINFIISIIVIAVDSYLLYPTVHSKKSTKTQIVVLITFATGLVKWEVNLSIY